MEQREHMLPISKVLLNFKNRNHDIQVEAEQLMHEYQRDIFGLNETRLQRDINDHEDADDNEYGKSFLIGHQNEEQREFIAEHDTKKTLYIEGPFNIWMNHIKEQYFILRSEPLQLENPLTHEDDTREREGMVLGICMTNKTVKDALQSWLMHLQKENPRLSDFKIIFNVNIPSDMVPSS